MLSVGARYNDNEEFCSNRAVLNVFWLQLFLCGSTGLARFHGRFETFHVFHVVQVELGSALVELFRDGGAWSLISRVKDRCLKAMSEASKHALMCFNLNRCPHH